jgi:hypothetical protein
VPGLVLAMGGRGMPLHVHYATACAFTLSNARLFYQWVTPCRSNLSLNQVKQDLHNCINIDALECTFPLQDLTSSSLNTFLTDELPASLPSFNDLTNSTPDSSKVSRMAQILKPICAGRLFCASWLAYDS